MSALLAIEHVTRRFPGVLALDDVSLDLRRGEVLALVGENGAGKSTLINILSGVLSPDEGRILLEGQEAGLSDPVTARKRGIVTVHQEAELFGSLSVAENMALGTGLPTTRLGRVQWRRVFDHARQAVRPLSDNFDVSQPASRLRVAERHLTQVAAAIVEKAKVVILDEPTSVLTAAETDWLFKQIDDLRAQGVGIIYISHRQEEIFRLADRVTVLRDGRHVWTGPIQDTDKHRLVEMMVGRAADVTTGHRQPTDSIGPERLTVRGFTDTQGRFHDIDLTVHAGEIVGLYGLVGSGRSEFAQAVYGLSRPGAGTVSIDGKTVSIRRPEDAVHNGIAYLPEDRLRESVFRRLAIKENAVIASLRRWASGPFVSLKREEKAAREQVKRFGVRMRKLTDPIEELSGGNQQKVILARWVLTSPKVLILDEPTRGVDVAAKTEIHANIRQLARDGCAVLMISSELPEVLAHADRIGVFREGRLVEMFDAKAATPVNVAAAALPQASGATEGHLHETVSTRPRASWIGPGMGMALAVALLAALLWTTTDGRFGTSANLTNLINNVAPRALLALAAASVIIAGGIDISIGSLLAFSAAIGGVTMKAMEGSPLAIPVGIAAGLLVGTAGGLINASVSLLGRIHPIVVTLGTMTIFRGLLTTVTGGNVVSGLPDSFGQLATESYFWLSGSAWVFLFVTIIVHLWLEHSKWGRYVYAIGASPTAARLVGISKARTWLLAYGAAGLLVGLAGMLELAQNRTMQSTMGETYELRAIAAAVIGGVAIEGGRGSVAGVLLGVLFLVMIENALVLWQVWGDKYDLIVGGLLLAAVVLDRWMRRREA